MKVSVLCPFYNHATLVQRVVDAVMAQDYSNIEMLFLDDASTDNTWEVLQQAVAKYRDNKNLLVLRNATNQGVTGAFNVLMHHATGDIFVIQGGDDLACPNRVSTIVRYWETATRDGAKISGGMHRTTYVDDDFKPLGKTHSSDAGYRVFSGEEAFDRNMQLHGAAAFYSRECFTRFGDLPPDGKYEDQTIRWRIVISGDWLEIDESLVFYRCVGGTATRFSTSFERSRDSVTRYYNSLLGMRTDLEANRARMGQGFYEKCAKWVSARIAAQKVLVTLLTESFFSKWHVLPQWIRLIRKEKKTFSWGLFFMPTPVVKLVFKARGVFGNMLYSNRSKLRRR